MKIEITPKSIDYERYFKYSFGLTLIVSIYLIWNIVSFSEYLANWTSAYATIFEIIIWVVCAFFVVGISGFNLWFYVISIQMLDLIELRKPKVPTVEIASEVIINKEYVIVELEKEPFNIFDIQEKITKGIPMTTEENTFYKSNIKNL